MSYDYTASAKRRDPRMKICSRARYRAKQIGVEFDLHFTDIELPTHCPVFGLELDYAATKQCDNSPSIDRVDSTKGYTKDNIWIVSWKFNSLKKNATLQELIQMSVALAKLHDNVV